ncbi:MAG TPA: FtsX-like permease family protein [Nocardioidaceae bacterium]|nr:FtsX-like permease family protein [Nocardioidaceae bacterium]
MLRAAWKNLLARKLRLLMSGFAIVIGVAFVAGSLIFTDTLNRAFDSIFAGSVGDVVVRPEGATGSETQSSLTVPASVVATAAGAEGAQRADGNVTAFGVFVVGEDGKVIGAQGAPGLGLNYNDAPAAHDLDGLTVAEGRAPQRAGEVALDSSTAEKAGYAVGDQVPIVTSGDKAALEAELVGIADFGGGSLAGASLTIFDTETAQDLFHHGKDVYTDVWVTADDGVSQQQLADSVNEVLPAGFVADTGDDVADEQASDVTEALSFITTFLLVFAAIALFVGSFLIINTFSILVAQRSRELALLRALGAHRRQVTRSVLFEALVIGFVGSTLGLALGFGLAQGLKAVFAQFGLDLSGSGLAFEPRTAILAYAVGMLVTAFAAYLPARRASRISPIEALRDDVAMPESSLRRRLVIGVAMIAVGGAGIGLGLFSGVDEAVWFVGAGVLLVLLGVALTSPVIGRPVVALVGLFYRRAFGTVGRLAEQNAVRNPRRTAATASALMIGLALVSTMAIVGQSAKASVDESIENSFAADFVVSNAVGVPFSPSVADRVEQVDGVETVARLRYAATKVDGSRAVVGGVDPAGFARALEVNVVEGSLDDVGGSRGILVDEGRAEETGVQVGDTVSVALPRADQSFEVVGLFEPVPGVYTSYLTSLEALAAGGVAPADNSAYVVATDGADRDEVAAGIDAVIADLPTVTLKDQAEYAEEQRAPIDQMLTLIYALLALAVIIAVLGIVNTLALSVIERTREVGLLRAVGLSRRQLRTMVRLESVVIALLGSTLGVVLGVVFGLVLLQSVADEGLTAVQVPAGQLAAFVGASAVVGVLAAVWPARRAAKLDVLRAITTE